MSAPAPRPRGADSATGGTVATNLDPETAGGNYLLTRRTPWAPYGGYKASGIGRQNGIEGLEQYLETETIGYR